MKRLAALPLIVFASCAHIPFFKHTPKEPAAEPAPPPPAQRAQKTSSVVAPAPDFTFAAPGKDRSLRSLRGQAVVIVFGRDAGNGAFKKQLKELAPLYQELASKGVIFIAAPPRRTELPLSPYGQTLGRWAELRSDEFQMLQRVTVSRVDQDSRSASQCWDLVDSPSTINCFARSRISRSETLARSCWRRCAIHDSSMKHSMKRAVSAES